MVLGSLHPIDLLVEERVALYETEVPNSHNMRQTHFIW